jgi:phosphatidylserine decarboxylase
MYHRFHAPVDGSLSRVTYVSGDTWNVNPPALKVVDRLFCKNERVVMDLTLASLPGSIALVPVAAILVASIRLGFLPEPLDLRYRGPNVIGCAHRFDKGDELGYFSLGSTILLFTTPEFSFGAAIVDGAKVRMGEALMTCRASAADR